MRFCATGTVTLRLPFRRTATRRLVLVLDFVLDMVTGHQELGLGL